MSKFADTYSMGPKQLSTAFYEINKFLKEMNLDDSPAQSNRNVADGLCFAQLLNEDSEILL